MLLFDWEQITACLQELYAYKAVLHFHFFILHHHFHYCAFYLIRVRFTLYEYFQRIWSFYFILVELIFFSLTSILNPLSLWVSWDLFYSLGFSLINMIQGCLLSSFFKRFFLYFTSFIHRLRTSMIFSCHASWAQTIFLFISLPIYNFFRITKLKFLGFQ